MVLGDCFDIRGTDGAQFAPFLDKERDLWIFSSDLCRSLYLSFDAETSVMGIDTLRYRPPKEIFKISDPDNYCYIHNFQECVIKNTTSDSYDISKCVQDELALDGVVNLQGCYGGTVPVYMSSPHFLNGDKKLLDFVDGLHPDKDLHDVIVDVEPHTGASLSAHKRIQVKKNMLTFPTDLLMKILCFS